MTYLFIGLVLMMIIGPIIAILPSRSQKQIMQLRQSMMNRGVSVQLTEIDDPNPNQSKYQTSAGRQLPAKMKVAAYKKALLGATQAKQSSPWHVTRQAPIASEVVFVSDKDIPLPDEARNLLETHGRNLPLTTHAIAWDGRTLVVYWIEQGDLEQGEKVFTFLIEGLQCLAH